MNRLCVSRWPAAALVGLIVLLSRSIAADTTLDLYHLGESDPGAIAGNVGNATTIDSGPGAHNLGRFNSPTYSSNVGAPGSTLSVAFNPSSNNEDYDGANPTTASTNIGIDAWIYPTVGNVSEVIAYNGNPGSSGWGLFEAGSDLGFTTPAGHATIIALVGGVDFMSPTVPSVTVPLNTWSEVTQILEGGTNELLLNGNPVASHADTARTPDTDFEIGNGFTGNIDEVRIFSTPEPTAMTLLAFTAFGFLTRRRQEDPSN